MDVGNCSETEIKEVNVLLTSEIYFPWGHGARRFVSMAPVFLSVVLILAKNITTVDSYRCCGALCFVVDVYFSGTSLNTNLMPICLSNIFF